MEKQPVQQFDVVASTIYYLYRDQRQIIERSKHRQWNVRQGCERKKYLHGLPFRVRGIISHKGKNVAAKDTRARYIDAIENHTVKRGTIFFSVLPKFMPREERSVQILFFFTPATHIRNARARVYNLIYNLFIIYFTFSRISNSGTVYRVQRTCRVFA